MTQFEKRYPTLQKYTNLLYNYELKWNAQESVCSAIIRKQDKYHLAALTTVLIITIIATQIAKNLCIENLEIL